MLYSVLEPRYHGGYRAGFLKVACHWADHALQIYTLFFTYWTSWARSSPGVNGIPLKSVEVGEFEPAEGPAPAV